ncbi:hypothetical protein [Acidithiobacillus ferridurans]|jgi:hypothetical protein|uniref:Uncharacterized protein n=3 Tax=root TaxID=1 RepID=A0A8X8G8F6_ACIFI|nr:hypothetical protein [Acidithiobacillus ferridurans]MBU2717268.1 hypothetical protein [Acidithiobacillus ferridurans]MBU2722760.1 hypothetical protein [Acidithiobacillus ferridurans]MBU2726245.1 hypothetical protein [Acidithiobacillus ferridurans]
MNMESTIFSGLFGILGTLFGGYITSKISEKHELRKEREEKIKSITSVQTEILLWMNRVTASVLAANMYISQKSLPPVSDDMSLMFRTHAATLYSTLDKLTLMSVTGSYGAMSSYAQGKSFGMNDSPFAYLHNFLLNTIISSLNAYDALATYLIKHYDRSTSAEYVLFYMPASFISDACNRELKKELPDPVRSDIANVKCQSEAVMKLLREKGYKEDVITFDVSPAIVSDDHAKPT